MKANYRLVRRQVERANARTPLQIGIVADTHGYLDANVLTQLGGCALVVHAGDVGADEVLEQLEGVGEGVYAVRGNNDVAAKWLRKSSAWLEQLVDQVDIVLPGGTLTVVHGHQINPARDRHVLLRSRFAHARAIVYGHSHRQVEESSVTPMVLNPGAAGRARTFGGPSCMVLTISAESCWTVSSYRFELTRPSPR